MQWDRRKRQVLQKRSALSGFISSASEKQAQLICQRACSQVSLVRKEVQRMKAAQLMSYDRWLAEHLEDLMEKYPGKVVAIQDGKIIAIGDSEAEVYRMPQVQGAKEMPLVFRVPTLEDFQAILNAG